MLLVAVGLVASVAFAAPVTAAPVAAPIRVAGAYPGECLRPTPFALLPGLIAGVADGRVSIASPTGGRATRVAGTLAPEQSSVGWSVDGQTVATGDGRLWGRDGRSAGRLFGRLEGPWAWAPSTPCAIGVTRSDRVASVLSVAVRGQHSHPLLRGSIV